LADVDELIAQLMNEQARAVAAVESLRALREEVTANERQLEGPKAAAEQIDFFMGFFHHGAEEIGRIAAGLPDGISRAGIDALRQLASNSAAEHRRLVQFRDKWVNKPLPYETMRALLTGISDVTRTQLDAFRGLTETATALDAGFAEQESKGFDRRALFSRLFKPEK
jgi:hypothetical protein